MQVAASRRWRLWRPLALVVALVLLSMLALGWFFPARWALAWVAPRLQGVQLEDVHGLLWDGRADRVLRADGTLLGQVRWQVSRRALFSVVPLHVNFVGPQLVFSGIMRASRQGEVRWDNVHLQAELELWCRFAVPALGVPRGKLRVSVDHAVLHDGWPLELDLHARWDDAAVIARGVHVALGALDAHAVAHAGVVDANFADVDGGPLQVAGALRISPLGWGLNARLRARLADPTLRRWLATLGAADAEGDVLVQRRVGLVSIPPVTASPPSSAVFPTRNQQGQP